MADTSTAPLGHSISAHRVHGWCSHCRDHGLAQEVAAWRNDEADRHAAESDGDPLLAIGMTYGDCTDCGCTESLVTSEVTLRTREGRRRAAGWKYCLNCEAISQEAARG